MPQAAPLGLRDDHELVQGLLRGAGEESGHRRLHPVPCQCLRVPERLTAALPLRQCQGGDLGRDEEKQPVWNRRMLDFAPRVGFDIRLCRPTGRRPRGRWGSGSSKSRATHGPACISPMASTPTARDWNGGQRCQPADSRHDQQDTLGVAGRGAAASREAAGPQRSGSISPRGPEGGPGRLRQLGGPTTGSTGSGSATSCR